MIREVFKKANPSTVFMTQLIFVVISCTVLSSIVHGEDKCCCEGICVCQRGFIIIEDSKTEIQPCDGQNVCEYLCSKKGMGDVDVAGLDCEKCNGEEVCPTKLIYGGESEQTELLRYFRDNVLMRTPEGQEITRLYYQWSPVIVKAMEEDEKFKEEAKEMIDGVLLLIMEDVE